MHIYIYIFNIDIVPVEYYLVVILTSSFHPPRVKTQMKVHRNEEVKRKGLEMEMEMEKSQRVELVVCSPGFVGKLMKWVVREE